ncbi:hypothetical protein [Vibrio anguillarum]|uniref:hypothetical protein n=1 Tax=Vibrio anguillarum TaxID=55601 RepID=UPI001F2F68B4|nr:hypothetical protein [Vibrio anguillarum]
MAALAGGASPSAVAVAVAAGGAASAARTTSLGMLVVLFLEEKDNIELFGAELEVTLGVATIKPDAAEAMLLLAMVLLCVSLSELVLLLQRYEE